MTAATPRVRVGRDPWATGPRVWYANCPWCGLIAEHAYSWLGAMDNAIEHATEEPCPALRLARLVRELEALRDEWHQTADAARHERGEWWRGARGAMRVHASQISAVLARAVGASA